MRISTAKVGRNDPCPCGSGRKFKKCCIDRTTGSATRLSPEQLGQVERQTRAHAERMEAHRRTHGLSREPIWANWRGRKVVAVGNQLIFQPPDRSWRTFHDFLLDDMRGLFGSKWADAEKAKPEDQRHPVYRMNASAHARMATHARESRFPGLYRADWNGDIGGLLTLAHDLFTVRDNAELQKRLLRRLRIGDQYQGARYELFVIASCVRAGVSIEYQDERDGTRKHPEFIGIHRATGLRVAVEAKSRHRPGVLGFKGQPAAAAEEHGADIRKLLLNALAKEPGMPFVVFIDVNLRGSTPSDGQTWFREVSEMTLPTLSFADRRKANMIICTNIPFHYADPNGPIPTSVISAHQPSDPPLFSIEQQVLEDIVAATRLFKNVPHQFPGNDWEAGASR